LEDAFIALLQSGRGLASGEALLPDLP
jgi:hypothetical protein